MIAVKLIFNRYEWYSFFIARTACSSAAFMETSEKLLLNLVPLTTLFVQCWEWLCVSEHSSSAYPSTLTLSLRALLLSVSEHSVAFSPSTPAQCLWALRVCVFEHSCSVSPSTLSLSLSLRALLLSFYEHSVSVSPSTLGVCLRALWVCVSKHSSRVHPSTPAAHAVFKSCFAPRTQQNFATPESIKNQNHQEDSFFLKIGY